MSFFSNLIFYLNEEKGVMFYNKVPISSYKSYKAI